MTQKMVDGVLVDLTPDEQAEFDAREEDVPPVPQSVTRRRALQALFLAGVTEQNVIDKINLLPSPQKELAMIEFKESLEFERNRPLVAQIGVALGLDLDALFIAAAALP